MNFKYYNVKGGIATPENPFEQDCFTYDKYGNVDGGYHNPDWIEFEDWTNTNTLPCINVPDGRYHKDELELIGSKELSIAGIDWAFALRSSPDRLVKLSEVVAKLEEGKFNIVSSMEHGVYNRAINDCINLIKSL